MCEALHVFFSLRIDSPNATDKAPKMDGGGESGMMSSFYDSFSEGQGRAHSSLFCLWVALHRQRTLVPDEPDVTPELVSLQPWVALTKPLNICFSPW